MKPLHAATLQTSRYILTAVGLPDGTAKILAADGGPFEMPWPDGYESAREQVIRTARCLEKHDPTDRVDWFVYDYLEEMFARLGGKPRVLSLTDYETEADLHFLKPEEKETNTLLLHRIGNHESRWRIESHHHIAVQFRTVRLKDYMDWLAREQLENLPENRARFIAS